jgi:hypothetical protein
MPNHTRSRLKSKDSGFRRGERPGETTDTLRLSRQNGEGIKTGNTSLSQLSRTDTQDRFTDYDAIEIFNHVLLKKRDAHLQEI